MIIKTIPITQINPAAYNPRKDLQPGDPEYKKLKKSLTEFDCVEPLVWNEGTGNLVGGHQRLKVLKDLGRTEVEVSVVQLDDAKEKALNLALNKISGEWDLPRLKDLLEEINTGAFDIEVTGFDDKEIEELMTQFHVPEEGLTDEEVIPEVVEPVCKKGDLWQLGAHRLLCGDATKPGDIERLMASEKADMVFTDPPYNVNYGSIVGHPSYKRTKGRTRINKTREGHPYWKDREAKGIGYE
jgi:ParB-like chromosome segregation protein Spo0J